MFTMNHRTLTMAHVLMKIHHRKKILLSLAGGLEMTRTSYTSPNDVTNDAVYLITTEPDGLTLPTVMKSSPHHLGGGHIIRFDLCVCKDVAGHAPGGWTVLIVRPLLGLVLCRFCGFFSQHEL